MRVAVTHPTCWPEIRRGSERLLHDLSHWLADRGHDVTVISTIEGPARTEQEGAVTRHLLSRRHPLPVRTRWWNFFHAFAGQVRDELAVGGFEAVHCLNYHDAWGAARARDRRFRLVYQLTGIPMRRYFRRIPLDGLIFGQVIRDADEVLALSTHALGQLHDQYGRTGRLVAAPTDTRPYAATTKVPSAEPLVLFVGDWMNPARAPCCWPRPPPCCGPRACRCASPSPGAPPMQTRPRSWPPRPPPTATGSSSTASARPPTCPPSTPPPPSS
jgi:hypothetical protein